MLEGVQVCSRSAKMFAFLESVTVFKSYSTDDILPFLQRFSGIKYKVCVCVCVRKRERVKERGREKE